MRGLECEGIRVWIKIVGFPMKLWHLHEWSKLIEDFAVLFGVDARTSVGLERGSIEGEDDDDRRLVPWTTKALLSSAQLTEHFHLTILSSCFRMSIDWNEEHRTTTPSDSASPPSDFPETNLLAEASCVIGICSPALLKSASKYVLLFDSLPKKALLYEDAGVSWSRGDLESS
jgi:hypothetical protein